MNQQRGRRFRSAREAQDLVRKALQKGTILPSEPRYYPYMDRFYIHVLSCGVYTCFNER